MMKTKRKKLWYCLVIFSFLAIAGMVYAAIYYRVNHGQTVRVDATGTSTDYDVKNKTAVKDYFVPNNTSVEWNAFLTACNTYLKDDLTCTAVVAPPPPSSACGGPGDCYLCTCGTQYFSNLCWGGYSCGQVECNRLDICPNGGYLISFTGCSYVEASKGVIGCCWPCDSMEGTTHCWCY